KLHLRRRVTTMRPARVRQASHSGGGNLPMRTKGPSCLRRVRGLFAGALRKVKQLFEPSAPYPVAPPRLGNLLQLEDRRLLSATPIAPDFRRNNSPIAPPQTLADSRQAPAVPQGVRQELVILDPGVSNYQQLMAGLQGGAQGR